MQFGANVSKASRYIVHLSCYYIAWVGCMYLAAHGRAFLSTILVIVCTCLQVIFERHQRGYLPKLAFLTALLVIAGATIDSLGVYLGLINFKANPFAPYATAPWMLATWANFAIIIYCLAPILLKKYILMAILCLPGFAAAYYLGGRIGAVDFPYGYLTCIGIGAVWSILLPICSYIYNKHQES
ncbi:MAG: DUF2878 domain-containing protein [Legionellaceae bacterium]|nr:DUF2878 domain-containing protein [Legionellaceae bacterium]